MKILIFEAVWCKDCKVMHPLWRSMKLENPELNLVHFEADDCKKQYKKFNVTEIPTTIFIDKKGKELERCLNIQHRDFIIELIKKYKNL